MERTLRWSPAPRRDDHSPIVQRAALALLLTLASWVPFGPNKGRVGRLKAFAPGLPTRQSEASPVASACLPAARIWRNFSCSWCKQEVDAACIPPARRQAAPLRARSSAGCLLAPTKGAWVDCVPLALACQRGSLAPLQVRGYQRSGVGATFPAAGASMTWLPPAFLLGARRQAPLSAQCHTSLKIAGPVPSPGWDAD